MAGLDNGVIMPTVIVLTCLPPALILLAAQLLQAPWLGYVGRLFAIIYGAALFAGVGVIVAGRLMLQREAELVAATKPPERE